MLPRSVLAGLVLLAGCTSHGTTPTPSRLVRQDEVRRVLSALADDSMEGRRTASPGELRAARFVVSEMKAIGLTPAGDSGFIQRVPLAAVEGRRGGEGFRLQDSWAGLDSIPAQRRREGHNVIGILPGSDPALRDEYILVDAHLDHLGVGRPLAGDSIYNGADDDASGVTAVLEIARALAAGPGVRRSVIFAATTGEEMGLLGTRWYIAHPARPLDQLVGNLEIEMIGRPDSLAGGPGRAWLTGYERSTMGDSLAAEGIPIVADPRPDQHFFERSDNIAFARMGIPAHTLSSFNLHDDYHRQSDEVSKVDFAHMTAVIGAAVDAVRILANGPRPEWHPGGRPEPAPSRH
ncbi:MAG TPA: M20/M25/M40 family metallo-hydrolase [Gemmatimonadales bacterium]|nr:M20/M25/M40 family metallo-hydrolase [Gemmatimonadales bacterium]